jgi:hypothetical protein
MYNAATVIDATVVYSISIVATRSTVKCFNGPRDLLHQQHTVKLL